MPMICVRICIFATSIYIYEHRYRVVSGLSIRESIELGVGRPDISCGHLSPIFGGNEDANPTVCNLRDYNRTPTSCVV